AQLKALDESGQSADDHLMSNQKESIKRVLTEIDEAFARADDGTYGTCLRCSKPVPPARLEILPHTRHCVACQRRAAWRLAGRTPGRPSADRTRGAVVTHQIIGEHNTVLSPEDLAALRESLLEQRLSRQEQLRQFAADPLPRAEERPQRDAGEIEVGIRLAASARMVL